MKQISVIVLLLAFVSCKDDFKLDDFRTRLYHAAHSRQHEIDSIQCLIRAAQDSQKVARPPVERIWWYYEEARLIVIHNGMVIDEMDSVNHVK